MKKLKLFFALFAMLALGVGNAWGETVTYQHVFNKKPSTGNSVALSSVNWKIEATALNNYNSNNYAGVQIGSSKAAGSITLTSITDWDYNGNGKITAVRLWLNTGGSTVTPTVTIGGKSATSDGTNVVKNSGAGSDWTKATKVTFTPVADGNTGVVVINVSTEKAGYICAMEIDCEPASSGGDEPVATLTANPTTIDFGTVYEGATVADKTVAVNFENLTGDVTYSGLSTPFTATGAISATGDKITISADASTIGEYSQTLTIASTVDSKTAEVTVKMNVVEKPAPTGTFTLHTGELIEGDYVIYYSGKAMKAVVSSNRLGYEEVTPSGNEIVDPLAATIWHIAPSGDNWTVYNNNKGYAAGTGTKSQAGLVANLTGDNANKAAWTITASGNAYEFVNVWNKSKSVNANLRNNTTFGFACYATGTGGALSLYRKAGAKYNVTVNYTTNGSVTASPTSAEAGATIALTVTPDAGYVLDALTVTDASSNTIEVADNKFTMPASDVTVVATFKLNEKPAATLTLSKNGVEETFSGSWKQDDVVTLPSITSDCVKAFVGWSANPTCNVAPEYKDGDEYTLAATTQTLYAVYATVQGGGEVTSEDLFENNSTYNATNPATIDWTLSNVVSILQEQGTSTSAVNSSYDKDPRWYKSHVITITPSVNITKIVTKAQSDDYATELANSTYTNATATANGDVVTITPTDGNEKITIKMEAQARLYTLTVTYASAATYSDYSTTCAAALANPTFSLTEGKYTEAKSVEITATEGTVYYTTDGITPTASSTQYTGAIALNDCGEYTIKAIAISADSQSDVVSATYTIKLPLTNSQAAPYTEAEAIAVYDGDCYDNQDVYVKGTVKTATFYNSGTYTITLTNGFQFYKFYKDGSKTLFTDGEINKGDVLVACGKLSKYNTTYQLAEGCYLVEHEPYTEPKTDISNTEATAYTVDKAFELIADVKSDLTKEVYVKGLVAVAPTSNPTADGQMTYKISDNGENTGNVLTVYLGLNLNGEKFTSKNDVQQGDYVVVKGKLLDYNSTYELNKGNQLVQHVKAASITIADITMEVGETKTIAATVVPAGAEVTYTIKENAANAISLSGNTITANAVGTATITATIAEGATYMGNSVDFTVTVGPKSEKTNVVILAEYKDKWYALVAAKGSANNTLGAVEVTYVNGVILDFDGDKASITWERAIVGNKATFKNGTNYVKGATGDTNLTLETSAFEWEVVDGKYLVESKRTFLYNKAGYFKNYDANTNAGKADYSAWPVVTAVEFMNSVTTPSVEKGIFSVADGKFVQFSTGNLQYEVGTNKWSFAENQYDYVGEENINVGNPSYTGKIDMFGWSADGKFGVNPSNKNEDYYGTFQDWGKLVDEADWYTLSADEWKYLLNTRANAANLKQIAKVGSVVGIMLFPDAWTMPTDVNVTAAYDSYFKVNIYNYTLEQWQKLEAVGAVFLPAAGRRTGGWGNTTISPHMVGVVELDSDGHYKYYDNGNIYCYYWTSTINESNDVSYLHNIQALGGDEYTIGIGAVWGEKGRYGQSVRLVKAITPNYKREVRQGYYGTICLQNGGQMIGASRFELSYYNEAQGLLYMDEADATMVAGNPYIFLPNEGADTLYVFYDETTPATEAGTVNGLVGSYTKEPLAVDATNPNYILKDNKISKVVGSNVFVGANKAYIQLGKVKKNEPAPVPGRRRVAIGQAPQVATGMESVDASAQPVKMIIDGQLYILRGEKMYDAQGKLVK